MQAIKKYTHSFGLVIRDVILWILKFFLRATLDMIRIAWRYMALTIALVFLYFGMFAEAALMIVVAFYFTLSDVADAINKQTEVIALKGWK
jgi:hypothetical protein